MESTAEAGGLVYLLRLDPASREEWLDRHQPASGGRVNWWLYLLLGIGFQIAGQPAQHREWVQLSLWLLDLVADEQLAGQLRDWIRVKPLLV